MREHDSIPRLEADVPVAIIEMHDVQGRGKLRNGGLARHLTGDDLLLQRLRQAERHLRGRAQLVDAVTQHSLLQLRGGEADRRDHRQSRQTEQ